MFCLIGKQIWTFSQLLTVTKQLPICVHACQKQKMNATMPYVKQVKIHGNKLQQYIQSQAWWSKIGCSLLEPLHHLTPKLWLFLQTQIWQRVRIELALLKQMSKNSEETLQISLERIYWLDILTNQIFFCSCEICNS